MLVCHDSVNIMRFHSNPQCQYREAVHTVDQQRLSSSLYALLRMLVHSSLPAPPVNTSLAKLSCAWNRSDSTSPTLILDGTPPCSGYMHAVSVQCIVYMLVDELRALK
jgi:hypothetical protein